MGKKTIKPGVHAATAGRSCVLFKGQAGGAPTHSVATSWYALVTDGATIVSFAAAMAACRASPNRDDASRDDQR